MQNNRNCSPISQKLNPLKHFNPQSFLLVPGILKMKNAITILIFCMVAIQAASCVKTTRLVKVLFVDTSEYSTLVITDKDPMYRALVTATAMAEFKDKEKKFTILKETIVFSVTGDKFLKERGGNRDNFSDFDYLLKLQAARMMVYTGPYEKDNEMTMLDQKTLALQVDKTTGYANENEHTDKLLATDKLWLEVIPPKTGADTDTLVGDGSGASSSSEPKIPTPNAVLRAPKRALSRRFSRRNSVSVSLGPSSLKYGYENLTVLNNLILQVV